MHETVKQAIATLYSTQVDPTVRQQATKWLESFQNTPDAWNVSMAMLLEGSGSSTEQTLFAARTLKHKVISDYAQLDEQMAVSLRDALWPLLAKALPTPILSQICLALAGLAVQMNGSLWPHPLQDALQQVHQHPQAMLQFLAMLPEQLANPSLPITDAFYREQHARLFQGSAQVIQWLSSQLSAGGDKTMLASLLSCLLAWVKCKSPEADAMCADPTLLRLALQMAVSHPDQEDATELVCEIIYRLYCSEADPSTEWMQTLFAALPHLAQLLQNMLSHLDFSELEVEDDDADDEGIKAVRSVGRIFVETGEAFMPQLLANPTSFEWVSQSVLSLCATPSLRLAEDGLLFWGTLSECSLSEQHVDRLHPLYTLLISTLIRKHLVIQTGWTAERRDRQREFRHLVGDTLKGAVRLLGSSAYLEIISQVMATGDSLLVEASLFALRCVASSVLDKRESEVMPTLMPALLNLTEMRYAVCLCLGSLADWIAMHPEWIGPILGYVEASFAGDSDSVASAAAQCLCFVAESGSARLHTHLPQLLRIYQRDGLKHARLFEALILVISTLPWEQQAEALSIVVMPLLPGFAEGDVCLDRYRLLVVSSEPDGGEMALIGSVRPAGLCPAHPAIRFFCEHAWPAIKQVSVNDANREAMAALFSAICENYAVHLPVEMIGHELLPRIAQAGCWWSLKSMVERVEDCPAWWTLGLRDCLMAAGAADSEDFLTLMKSAIDYAAPAIRDDHLMRLGLNAISKALTSRPLNPSAVDYALLALLHTLHQLLHLSKEEADFAWTRDLLPACLTAVLQSLLDGSLPLNAVVDVSSLLRRYYNWRPEQVTQLLDAMLLALPSQVWVEREKELLREQLKKGLKDPRAREMRETLIHFTQTCRRRL